MSKKMNEKDVLRKMNIESFEELKGEKIFEFCSYIDKMDPEVAKKALEQTPEFMNMAKGIYENYSDLGQQVIKSNDANMRDFYGIIRRVTDCLCEQLDKEELTAEEKKEVQDNLFRLIDIAYRKDTEDKKHQGEILGGFAIAGVIAIVLGAGALGVGAKFGGKKIV